MALPKDTRKAVRDGVNDAIDDQLAAAATGVMTAGYIMWRIFRVLIPIFIVAFVVLLLIAWTGNTP